MKISKQLYKQSQERPEHFSNLSQRNPKLMKREKTSDIQKPSDWRITNEMA